MFNRPLNSFLPSVYENVVEMDDIMNSEEQVMDIARREMYSAFSNTFVLTADVSGVIMFEKMLNIVANVETEDLEFRRQRIMNRLSMSPPFTFRFLEQKLNEIMGVGTWNAYIDFDTYTLYIESSAVNQSWYSEVEFTINRIKPCNIVFINVPLTTATVNLSEEISYLTQKWSYRLGSWKLGKEPFASLEEGGVLKLPNTKSVQSSLLSDTANFVASDISYVLINDSIKITDIEITSVSSNAVSVQYNILPSMTTLITDIKLKKANGSTLTQAAVYVPVTQTVISKHIITVKEGA